MVGRGRESLALRSYHCFASESAKAHRQNNREGRDLNAGVLRTEISRLQSGRVDDAKHVPHVECRVYTIDVYKRGGVPDIDDCVAGAGEEDSLIV